MSLRESLLALIVAAAICPLMVACDSNSSNPVEPEPAPEAPILSESFQGQLEQLETSCHDFELTVNGDIELEITSLEPLSTLTVGLSIGLPDPAELDGCAAFVRDGAVQLFEVLVSSGLLAGPYCACIEDVGNIFPDETVDYTLEVRHP